MGLAEAQKTVRVICGTQRGSVPHSPDLGVDWLDVIDRPLSEATRLLVLDVHQQMRVHAPQILITKVRVLGTNIESGKVVLRVYWTLSTGSEEQVTLI